MKQILTFKGLVLGVCFWAYGFSGVSQDTLTLTWQGSSSPSGNNFIIGVTMGETYTVDWGDGTDTTLTSMIGMDAFAYTKYVPASTYTLTVTTATSLGRITTLFLMSDKISKIDVSNCTALTLLFCNNNLLDSLDLSKNVALTGIACDSNCLQLSDLYAVSQLISNPGDKILGYQALPPQTALVGQTLFSSQSIFGGIYTNYAVTKNGIPASLGDYTVTNGTIMFNDTGTYNVTMTNAAIVSNASYPAEVVVDITVIPAPEAVTFTWQANTIASKDILITATAYENYMIDWGNGVVDTFAAGAYGMDWINYTYPAAGTYTVTLFAATANCHFTLLYFFPSLQISKLNVGKCPFLEFLACAENLLDSLDVSNLAALADLDCAENNLSYLNISGCTALDFLVCRDNPLTRLNINSCTALTYLSCSDNLLDSLDVSNCTILEGLDCSNNQLDSLNLNNNTALESLYCSNNQLNSLNLTNNAALTALHCDTNHLPLSDLYAASQKIVVQSDKGLGHQTLPPQTVFTGDTLFQTESVFNSVYTNYAVTKNGVPASVNDYTIANGTLIFNDTGIFTATMTNAAIVSDVSFPAEVVVDIEVLPAPITVITDTITFTWTTGADFFGFIATLDEPFTVNWGDGTIDTFTGTGYLDGCLHIYSDTNDYTVTVAASTANCRFTLFYHYPVYNNDPVTSLDVSKSPALEYLVCVGSLLDTLDVSNNPFLAELVCNYNRLTALDVSNNPVLYHLECSNNLLDTLDISNSTALRTLKCDNNQLHNLDVRNNISLQSLDCSFNLLNSLDVSNNILLEQLNCSNNQLNSLEVSNNPVLYHLECSNNLLDTLDMSNSTALITLKCDNNQLRNLDVSNNISLQALGCSFNLLNNLDVSNNMSLQALNCSNNQLNSLDMSSNTALKDLYCSNNQLNSLNLTNNTALAVLHCDTNHLPLSDLYAASQKIVVQSDKGLGYQTLPPQTVFTRDTLFQTESVFNSVYTNYAVMKNGVPASVNDYTIANGTLIFRDSGTFTVTMTNAAIVSDVFYPAEEVVDITVIKKIGTDASLSDLTVSDGVLTPAFDSDTLNYTVNVAYSITDITITATANDINATIIGDTGTQQLAVGANTFAISVTAEDGITELNYTVTVIRAAPNTDASLKNLTASGADLNPVFSSTHYNYVVCLETAVRSIALTATPNDPNATVIGDGQQQLNPDTNQCIITVTAEDGITTQDYIVTVINGCDVGIVGTGRAPSLRAYPNPTTGKFSVFSYQLSEMGGAVEIYDVVGQVVGTYRIRPESTETTIDISHLAKGLYFLKVDGKVFKVVKQ